MIEKFEKLDNRKKVPIVFGIVIVLIVLIVLYAFNRKSGVNVDIAKEYDDKELVYTADTIDIDEIFHIYVPHININNSFIKNINEDIDSYVSDFIDKEMVILSYDYNVNGKVLSLVIKAVDYDPDYFPYAYFKTYNINLETNELVSDGELLNSFDITEKDVNDTIEKQFKSWYDDEAKKGYIEKKECDYECFLEYREIEDYMEDVNYYVDSGRLVVFKPFSVYSVYGEENYYKEEDFEFIIK